MLLRNGVGLSSGHVRLLLKGACQIEWPLLSPIKKHIPHHIGSLETTIRHPLFRHK